MEYRDVIVKWRDTNDEFNAIVCVGGDSSEDDERVFFYFENEAEFEDVLKNGEDDFEMWMEVN